MIKTRLSCVYQRTYVHNSVATKATMQSRHKSTLETEWESETSLSVFPTKKTPETSLKKKKARLGQGGSSAGYCARHQSWWVEFNPRTHTAETGTKSHKLSSDRCTHPHTHIVCTPNEWMSFLNSLRRTRLKQNSLNNFTAYSSSNEDLRSQLCWHFGSIFSTEASHLILP